MLLDWSHIQAAYFTFQLALEAAPIFKGLNSHNKPLGFAILNFRWMLLADVTVLCLFLCISEGLHRFCHQCQALDPLHAPESPHLPVSSVALCGVAVFWVHRPGHDRSQHHCADDEGEENKETEDRKNMSLEFERCKKGVGFFLSSAGCWETGRQMQGDSACIKYWSIISKDFYLAWPH